MKKIIITLVLGLITKFSFGQNLKPNSTVRINHSIFNVKALDHGSMVVANEKNSLVNKKPKLPQSALNHFEKTDQTALLNVFTNVFSTKRLKELLPENGVLVNYYVSPQGKVLEVSFLLNTNTLLTAEEIKQIEDGIKNNVKFSLRPEETNGGDFFIITQVVKYKKILDRTLK